LLYFFLICKKIIIKDKGNNYGLERCVRSDNKYLIAGSVAGALVIWLIIALILYLIIRSGENEKKEQEIRAREFREKNNEK